MVTGWCSFLPWLHCILQMPYSPIPAIQGTKRRCGWKVGSWAELKAILQDTHTKILTSHCQWKWCASIQPLHQRRIVSTGMVEEHKSSSLPDTSTKMTQEISATKRTHTIVWYPQKVDSWEPRRRDDNFQWSSEFDPTQTNITRDTTLKKHSYFQCSTFPSELSI